MSSFAKILTIELKELGPYVKERSMDKKQIIGTQIPNFTFNTPFERNKTLYDVLSRVPGKTAIVFLRFYGCRLSKYDILQYAQHYREIVGQDHQLLVVLQSEPIVIAEECKKEDFAFDIVCDPTKALYEAFEVGPGLTQEAVLHDALTQAKLKKAVALGIVKRKAEGDILQLPATFIINQDRKIIYSSYGISGGDAPSAEDLKMMLLC